ncbi:urea ABC transporter substrate-binding protein [Nitrosopumilus ureiphilus]|uniref:Urea ABC transporter substrate-binding protein n=1 Tax=Nitrosopumilus ureiphilus TaxID=1470067 RepID=A0A7D5M6L3_9ARCH|nr:urea ABC transporter substrate-binding protein [Nitrosopumilus ureiphilus]QLH07695.1 urea ABC transporter substrate-binding protein [Nitrosopumilus ureiphilus]
MNKILIFSVIGIISVMVIGFTIHNLQNDYTNHVSNNNDLVFERPVIPLDRNNPIKIGILHSLSGTMAISEIAVVDSTLMAIEEINEKGGILGREVVPIVKDGSSNWDTFAEEAENLIVDENVSVVFGGWTSASRKTMKPIFEKYDHLLFYPVQYEGLEKSPNIIYTGASPNQQVLPAVKWAYDNLGTKFFLIGSDYVFPRSANEIIKDKINELGGTIMGEEYRLLGDTNFDDVVDKISESKPDVILNTVNGDSNLAFFKQLREKGISSEQIPTISFSIAEDEIRHFGVNYMQGDYASWNYFQSLTNEKNRQFVNNFQKKYGLDRVVDDPMEAGYIGVYLYAKAVESVGTDDIPVVREALRGMTFHAPEGPVGIDPHNQHLSKVVRIGKILPDGQFKIVSSSEKPIKPEPFPEYKTEEQWNSFLEDLYVGWDENWANPKISQGVQK